MTKQLVIKVTAGADAPERCSQAFTVAAVAVASGVEVSLWLTGESAWFALPGRAGEFQLPHAAPLPVIVAPRARCTDPHGVVGSVGPRHPMAGMRGSGADIDPCRQHGGQSARHEHVSEDAPVARYAVVFQYEVPFTRRLFLGAWFPV